LADVDGESGCGVGQWIEGLLGEVLASTIPRCEFSPSFLGVGGGRADTDESRCS
jgi:hypothetical protein